MLHWHGWRDNQSFFLPAIQRLQESARVDVWSPKVRLSVAWAKTAVRPSGDSHCYRGACPYPFRNTPIWHRLSGTGIIDLSKETEGIGSMEKEVVK